MRLKILLFSCLLFVTSVAFALEKQTYLYASKPEQDLYLDFYTIESDKPTPCVFFLFGGGFLRGNRDNEYYNGYFQFLNDIGYSVISIDYRLGLKGISADMPVTKFPNTFLEAINMAVEDLYDATLFTIENAQKFNIDPKQLILSGSSAGAITILQAEYNLCHKNEIASKMPDNFNYAGLLSYAGAIMLIGPTLQWVVPPCPIMLFHGDADNIVTFNKVGVLCANLYGSNYIADQLKRINAPFYFYTEENVDHAMASMPLNKHRDKIKFFLDEFIQKEKRLQIVLKMEDMEIPEKKKPKSLMDYVEALTKEI